MEKPSYLERLVENTPLALVVIGLFLVVVAAAGGWPKPELQVNEFGWRVALGVMGAIVAGVGGLLLWRRGYDSGPEDGAKYGIRIASPREGDRVYITEVSGTYEVKPPADKAVWVFEISPTRFHHWPKRRVYFNEQQKQWRASDVYVGGRPGDERFLMVAVVGKAGQALCEYHERVGEQTKQWPGIVTLTPDIVECARITVKRSGESPEASR